MSKQPKPTPLDGVDPTKDPVGAVKACIKTWDELEILSKQRKTEVSPEQALINLEWLDTSAPVVSMTGTEVPHFDKVRLLAEWVGQYWQQKTGGVVNRSDLGDIVIDTKAAKYSANHGMSANKAKAFWMVPEAIQKGVLLGALPEVKGKPKAFIIAAPVAIGGDVYRLLMEVRSDANMQRLYVHEVVLREAPPLQSFKIGANSAGNQPSAPARGDIYNFMLNLRKAQELKKSSITPTGRTNPVKTAKGTKLNTQFAVVEADRLIVSHDANGKESPNFPQELQPRDRARETSQAWVQKVAANLDPDSLGRTSRADSGAPIVGPDAVVESGNGRTMAIKLAYERGTAEEYRQWLIDDAEYFGLDADQIKGMQSPVLVRVRTSETDRQVFVVEANQDDKLTLTATEQARSDAKRLDEQLLGLFAPGEDGDLLTSANQRFIQGFLKSLGETEAAQYMTTDGKPTKGLVDRIKAAIFSKAYNDDRLLEMMADQTKPEIQNVLNALGAAAPRFIEAQGFGRVATESVSEQMIDGIEQSLDQRVVDAVVKATNTLLAAKANNQDIAEYVKQQGLFEDIDEGVAALAVFLAKNGRSAKRMAVAFKAMATFVKNDALDQQNGGLFGEPQPPSMVDVVAAANRELQQQYGDDDGNTIGLFDSLTPIVASGLKAQLDALDTSSDPVGAVRTCLEVWDTLDQASTALSDHYKDANYRYKDVGYIAGSRKELAQSSIMQAKKAGQLVQSTDIDWDALESDPRIAADTITKANVFGKPDWEALREGGMDGNAAYLIKRMYAAVALEPDDQSPEGRKLYVTAIQNLRSTFEGCKTVKYVIDEMITLSKLLQTYSNMVTLPDGTRELNYDSKVAHALGKKFRSWIFKTGNTAIRDARKIGDLDWDWLEASDRSTGEAKPKKTRFQLEAASDIERVGGEPVNIVSTEQFKDKFGLRAVQSGNWVLKDKESIEFHVQRAAEAFVDMADVTGISVEQLGFGGRLGLSFGARGKGGALAHYEPVQRVINITKMKGGGSLGHEYFHALDNVILDLIQQQNNGKAGYFATHDPSGLPDGAIKRAFINLRKAMLIAPQGVMAFKLDDRLRSDINGIRMGKQLLEQMRAANIQTPADVVEFLSNTGYSTVAKGQPLSKYAQLVVAAAMRELGMISGMEDQIDLPALWEESQFKIKAVILDDGKEGKYWSQPLEMAARAYSAYLQDRLADKGRKNDYLAYSTQGGHSRVGEIAYPQGDERLAVNAAFDQLFKAIKDEQVFEKATQNEALLDALFGTQSHLDDIAGGTLDLFGIHNRLNQLSPQQDPIGAIKTCIEAWDIADDADDLDIRELDPRGNDDVPSASGNLESDRQNATDPKPNDGSPDANGSAGTEPLTTGTRSDADRGGNEREPILQLPADDATGGGTPSHQQLYRPDGTARPASGPTGSADGSGSGGDRVTGSPTQRERNGSTLSHAVTTGSLAEKIAAQAAAPTETAWGNRDSIDASLPLLLPEQRDDVLKAEARLIEQNENGILFTNGTGTGKTYTGLGIAKRFANAGKANILIVTLNDKICRDFVSAGKNLGLSIHQLKGIDDHGSEQVVVTTYANFGQNKTLGLRDWDLIVVDESHTLMQSEKAADTAALKKLHALSGHHAGFDDWAAMRYIDQHPKPTSVDAEGKATYDDADLLNWGKFKAPLRNQWAENWKKQTGKRAKVIFLSATPFAYVPTVDWAEGYLFHYTDPSLRFTNAEDMDGYAYNSGNSREKFFMSNFGYRMRYNRLTRPDGKVRADVMEKMFAEQLKRSGAMTGRELSVPFDYDRKFVLLESRIGTLIDDGFKFLQEYEDGYFRELSWALKKNFDHLKRQRLLEAIKAEDAIDQIRKHMSMGRKVVVFHDYNEGGSTNPFVMSNPHEDPTINRLYDEFASERPDLINMPLDLPSPIVNLTRAFPKALLFNGRVAKAQRSKNADLFNQDDSGHDLIIVQSDAGSTGISFHDTTGKHQRVIINIGMPQKPAKLRQTEGRIYRVGQASNAIHRYITTGTDWERSTFASKIAERAETVDNLAMGESSMSSIKDALIEAYEAAEYFEPSISDGVGGKALDEEKAKLTTLSDFDRAKTLFYGKGKNNKRRDQREGMDWYATAEPIGLKMVQFAGAKVGDDVLEPSAGDGAIGRFVPDGANLTMIEPSDALASRAQLNNTSANVIVSGFEDHEIVNKYDSIVMNPPFGIAGTTAIQHIEKALKHLRDRGRVVALIPRGAMDSKLEALLAHPTMSVYHQVANIELPTNAFENAGTSVRTRIVVIDRYDRAADVPSQIKRLDYSNADSIEDLFDRIADLEITPRKPRWDEVLEKHGVTHTVEKGKHYLQGESLPSHRSQLWSMGMRPTTGYQTEWLGSSFSSPVIKFGRYLEDLADLAKAKGVKPALDSLTIDDGAHRAATSPRNSLPEPTDAQKIAGVYQLGECVIAGLKIKIENPEGSMRSGIDEDGERWENTMTAHYGYISNTTGADGDQIDVFVKPKTPLDWEGTVYVIDQTHWPVDSDFDEHKVILGVDSEEEAKALYLSNYESDWGGLGDITAVPMRLFKLWLKSGECDQPLGSLVTA